MRLSPTLTSLVAGTFYGTAANAPIPRAFDHMAIDPDSGDVFIVSDGHSGLPNTTGGIQPAPLSNGIPGIVVRISSDLDEIVQASYISGTDPGNTAGTSPVTVALHPANGDLYVAGYTAASSFPETSGGAQATIGGTSDGFVTRMTPDLLAAAASPGTLQFAQATYTVGEGNTTAQITVNRTGGTDGAVSVTVATSDDTAAAGSDYTAATGALSWADGDGAAKTFEIDIQDDALDEADENVGLTLTNATGGATLGSQATAALTITDNDVPAVEAGTVQFSTGSASVDENGGSVTLTLTRTNGADGAISVSVATGGGSASAGTDYTTLTQAISWAADDATDKTVALAIADDTADEPNETVIVTLSSPTGGATLGAIASTTVTIVDDDAPVTPPPPPAADTQTRGSYGGGGFEWGSLLALAALLLRRRSWLLVAGAITGVSMVRLLRTRAPAQP
jgi:hypothetical protein